MNCYLFLIIILTIIGVKIYFKKFNKTYLSKESTAVIKGIFILIVFYSHLSTYMVVNPKNGYLMIFVSNFLGQLMVTLFLFYSGYGIYESIKKKGKQYINRLPVNRILKTWVKFAIAIFSFLIVAVLVHDNYDIGRVLKSFVGWDAIGNSNWYIFAILVMYFLTFVSFMLFYNKQKIAIFLNLLLTVGFIIFMSHFKYDYWFNTVLCYNLGIFYSYYKDKIEKFLFNNLTYIITLLIVMGLFVFLTFYDDISFWIYEIYSMIFVIMIVLITMKISFSNKILKWFGDNLFWVYILQRIPMIIFQKMGLSQQEYLYALICFLVTIILTFIYNHICDKYVDKIFMMFSKIKSKKSS